LPDPRPFFFGPSKICRWSQSPRQETDRAAGELGAEVDQAAGELGAQETDRVAGELGAAEANRATGEPGAAEADRAAGELGADNAASLHLHAALGFQEIKRLESERSAAAWMCCPSW
jgi:hypothetical protein